MIAKNAAAFETRKLFEPLAMMTVGACIWFISSDLGIIDTFSRFAEAHGLMKFMLLCACIGTGGIFALVRSAFQLRRAIDARRDAEALAERAARQDTLTGLGNRRLFNEELAATLAKRRPNESFAVLLIDLDRFKPVNDVHGHAAGNEVLRVIADRLVQRAPKGSVVARLGGDEFAAILPGIWDEAEIGHCAQAMIDAVRRRIQWRQGHLEVDATIGVAVASSDTTDPEALLHAADIAMYEGKRAGRGVYRFFRQEMDNALKAKAQLESDLRSSIAQGLIKPFYQPIVALPNRELVGFEVLARWEHPTLGEIEPQQFIPIAEDSGQISEMFTRVLKSACQDAKTWPGHIYLAVNLSPRQLQDARMAERVLAVLTQTGFPAERLEVEVTETALINDIDAARLALTSLQNLGVKIALDNFGTGYSILYHLNELRFNKLKIDRSYVAALGAGGDRAKLVEVILRLGSNLSLQTTAEGIETSENLEWLSNQGCSFGQGYLFGRAMPRREAESYIMKNTAAAPRRPDARRISLVSGGNRSA